MKSLYRLPITMCFALILLASCATTQGDSILMSKLSPQKKAQILYDEGVIRYNDEILEKNQLESLSEIRGYFEAAMELDPLNNQAEDFLKGIDAFAKRKYRAYIANATSLSKKSNRTAAQDYDLLLSIKKASDIDSSGKELPALRQKAAPAKEKYLAGKIAQLQAVEPKIIAETSLQKMLPNLKSADRLISSVFSVDPSNGDAKSSQKNIDKHVTDLVDKDLELAKTRLSQKRYGDAEIALLRAEKSLSAVSSGPSDDLRSLKYQVYYAWGTSLYNQKKYQSAEDKINSALRANRTPEAAALKTKISQDATARDYDAEIDDILASVDSRISSGDAAGAVQIVNKTLDQVKNPKSISSLNAKKKEALELRNQIYQDGIALYNDEDYDGAKQKFRAVVAIDPGYEQAKSYLDRTITKIKALSGAD
jgi:hypothetical protein